MTTSKGPTDSTCFYMPSRPDADHGASAKFISPGQSAVTWQASAGSTAVYHNLLTTRSCSEWVPPMRRGGLRTFRLHEIEDSSYPYIERQLRHCNRSRLRQRESGPLPVKLC